MEGERVKGSGTGRGTEEDKKVRERYDKVERNSR